MRYFEVSEQAHKAATLGRWMMDLTYKVKEDHELANTLSKIGEMLCEFEVPHGTRWSDFTIKEKKMINKCAKIMARKNASS